MASSTVRFESRIMVNRPASVVFERLADLPAYRSWMHRTGLFRRCGLTAGDGPVGQGTAYFDATRMGTFKGEVARIRALVAVGVRGDVAHVRLSGDAGPSGVLPRGGRGPDDHPSPGRWRALRRHAADEAGCGIHGEVRTDQDVEVPESFAGDRLGPTAPRVEAEA